MTTTLRKRRSSRTRDEALDWNTAPEVLTVEEAALLARIPRNACYEAIRLGILPAANFGKRRTRVRKQVLKRIFGEGSPLTAAFNRPLEAINP